MQDALLSIYCTRYKIQDGLSLFFEVVFESVVVIIVSWEKQWMTMKMKNTTLSSFSCACIGSHSQGRFVTIEGRKPALVQSLTLLTYISPAPRFELLA